MEFTVGDRVQAPPPEVVRGTVVSVTPRSILSRASVSVRFDRPLRSGVVERDYMEGRGLVRLSLLDQLAEAARDS